jgi:hypothetical protein
LCCFLQKLKARKARIALIKRKQKQKRGDGAENKGSWR